MLHLVQKSLKKRKKEKKGVIVPMASPIETIEEPRFPQFAEFHDDICRIILSFVADAPFEEKLPGPICNRYRQAALTSTLPMVNKTFYDIVNSDFFWRPALLRQLENEDTNHLWLGGLRRLLPSEHPLDESSDLLEEVKKYLGDDFPTHKEIYKTIITRHIRFEAPVFIMPSSIRIGEAYGLHLFEPRYRIMLRDVLNGCSNPDDARNGGDIVPGISDDGFLQPPLLIHACLNPRVGHGDMCCLVQIVWCRTYEGGRADVQFLPTAWVQLDKVWVQRSQGHLFYAKARRL